MPALGVAVLSSSSPRSRVKLRNWVCASSWHSTKPHADPLHLVTFSPPSSPLSVRGTLVCVVNDLAFVRRLAVRFTTPDATAAGAEASFGRRSLTSRQHLPRPTMSGKDYPYDGQPRYPPGSNGPSPAPYYNPSYSVSQQSTPAPSYHSGPMQSGNPQYLGPPGDAHGAGHAFGSSPFDSVFDDNVYPVQSKPYGSRDDLLPQGQYPDTAYYSPGRLSPDMRPAGAEDIPLEDRAGKDVDMNDHIYDDPNGGRSRRRKKAKRVDLGQLGMIGADRKRIPWVVYTFSIVQIAVLIGELVNNGRIRSWTAEPSPLTYIDLTAHRNIDGLSHHDSPAVQSHDWSIIASSDQHGCSLCSMHALRPVRSRCRPARCRVPLSQRDYRYADLPPQRALRLRRRCAQSHL